MKGQQCNSTRKEAQRWRQLVLQFNALSSVLWNHTNGLGVVVEKFVCGWEGKCGAMCHSPCTEVPVTVQQS